MKYSLSATLRAVSQGRRQSGLSMIELMVAVTLSLVMLGGVLALFISSKKGYAVQDAAGRMQENARFASAVLDEGLRMADFWGGLAQNTSVTLSSTIQTLQSNASPPCNALIAAASGTTPGSGIVGYSAGTYSSLPTSVKNCIGGSANYVPNTDVLVMRFADPDPANMVPDGNKTCGITSGNDMDDAYSTTYANTIYLRSQTGFAGWLFQGSDWGAAGAGLPTNLADTACATTGNPTFNYPYHVELFYVRPCAVQANYSASGLSGTCQSTDDGGQPRPTLMEATFSSSCGGFTPPCIVPQAVVDDVEMLKIVYGVDTAGTKVASQYELASAVSSGGFWTQVLSVQYSIVVRGDTANANATSAQQDTTNYPLVDYPITGTYYTAAGASLTLDSVPNKNYPRRVYSATVQLRNRLRMMGAG